MSPLILQARSGRYSIQCRHGVCEAYLCGFPTQAKAAAAAEVHMLTKHGVAK